MSKIMVYLYFAYGSNLLASRMHVQNPAAKRVGVARLDDHRLDFKFPSGRWGGHAATIVPHVGRHVWGALWEVTDLDSLDRQEGVFDNIYQVRQVNVTKLDDSVAQCRTYQLVDLPTEKDRKLPSRVYLETILQGARETGVPAQYLEQLKKIAHDGFEGPVTVPGFNISFVETLPHEVDRKKEVVS